MPNGNMTTKEYLVQIFERLKYLTERFDNMEKKIEHNTEEIIKIKIKVVTISVTVSFIVTLGLLILKRLIFK